MKIRPFLLMAVLLLVFKSASAQTNEVGFLVGATSGNENQFEQFPQILTLRTDASFTVQFDYARRLFNARVAALYFDVPLIVIPSTGFKTSSGLLPKDFSSFFFTPGLKVKLIPFSKFNPYFVAGAGFARLNPSDIRIDGQPLQSGSSKTYGAYTIGGGIDVKVFPFVSLRGEVRDVRTGSPQLSINLFEDREHYVVTTAGIVLRF